MIRWKPLSEDIDAWSYVHMAGCGLIAFFLVAVMRPFLAIALAIGCGVFWEYLDYCNGRYRWGIVLLDTMPSRLDIFFDAVGAIVCGMYFGSFWR